MNKKDFFAKALLSIAASGVYGKRDFQNRLVWDAEVEDVATGLFYIAQQNHCFDDDKEEPP